MVKMIELATGKEITFNKVTEAAKFLGMATSSLYNKYKTQSKSRGYRITLLELSDKGRGKSNDFKHYTYGRYKIDFYSQTAIIKWTRYVDDDFDELSSCKRHKKAISDTLRGNMMFDMNFILLTDIWPHSYTNLPVEKEDVEIYLQFKRDIPAKDKKAEIRKFLDSFVN